MHPFSVYLFQHLYMFRAASAHHQEGQLVLIHHLVQCILVGDCLAGRSHSHPPECVIPDGALIQVGLPDDEHLLLETCRCVEINTLRKSASTWSLTRSTRYSCQIFMNLKFSLRRSEKYSSIKFMKIRPVWAELFHADGRTDRHEEANSRFS